jgi:very-short-patch-repair endonuclease
MKKPAVKITKPKIKKPERYAWFLPMLQERWPDAVAEFRFHPTRKWRSDFSIPSKRLLIEVEGGIFSGGRHTRGAGFMGDMEKYNAAAILGYRVLRYSPQQLKAHTSVICDIHLAICGGIAARLADVK